MSEMQNKAAVFFDFDDTLIHGDSLLMFLEEMVGWTGARRTFALAAAAAWRDRALGGETAAGDFKGAVKTLALRWALTGAALTDCQAAAARVADRLRWDAGMLGILAAHQAAGDAVVLATGALDIYLPALIGRLEPWSGVLATGMALGPDGRLTGEMSSANCVRREKARRAQAWLAERGPFARTVGYGNRPSDLPMLAIMDEGWEVRLQSGGRPARRIPAGREE